MYKITVTNTQTKKFDSVLVNEKDFDNPDLASTLKMIKQNLNDIN